MIMEEEVSHTNGACNSNASAKKKENHLVRTSYNWEIDNDKNFDDCVSTVSLSQAPDRTNLEDVVSLDTCVALKSDPSKESCRLEFKLTNKQKIARIAVVSEASVLEFFKQCGEYATTVFAEFVDDFQDHAVYFAEAKIQPPSTEASIKFTRTKNKGTTMWIYGIKLILTEPESEGSNNTFDLDLINSFLNNVSQSKPGRNEMVKKVLQSFSANGQTSTGDDMHSYLQKLTIGNFNSHEYKKSSENDEINQISCNEKNADASIETIHFPTDELKMYIDEKFASLEQRLMERIDLVDKQTNQKLDEILKLLNANVNEK